jgi:hypothetical protein
MASEDEKSRSSHSNAHPDAQNNERDQEKSDGIALPAHVAVVLSRLRSSLWTYLCGLSLKSQGTKGGSADYKNNWDYGVWTCRGLMPPHVLV